MFAVQVKGNFVLNCVLKIKLMSDTFVDYSVREFGYKGDFRQENMVGVENHRCVQRNYERFAFCGHCRDFVWRINKTASLVEFTVGGVVADVVVGVGAGVIEKVGKRLLFTSIILSATAANSTMLSVDISTSIC